MRNPANSTLPITISPVLSHEWKKQRKFVSSDKDKSRMRDEVDGRTWMLPRSWFWFFLRWLCSHSGVPWETCFLIKPSFPGYAYSTRFLFLMTKRVPWNLPIHEEWEQEFSRSPDLTGHKHSHAFSPQYLNREGRRNDRQDPPWCLNFIV
jgi:hypothetical protein